MTASMLGTRGDLADEEAAYRAAIAAAVPTGGVVLVPFLPIVGILRQEHLLHIFHAIALYITAVVGIHTYVTAIFSIVGVKFDYAHPGLSQLGVSSYLYFGRRRPKSLVDAQNIDHT